MYMYKRFDAKNWAKWKCYPGALTLLIPRISIMILSILALSLTINILLIGTTPNEKPIKNGIRKGCIKFLVKFTCNFHCIFGFWAYCTYEFIDWDYEEYLGKQIKTKRQNSTSTIICNHIGFLEIYNLLITPLFPSFCAKSELK